MEKKIKGRLTPQRLAILQYLEGNKEHPSAEEIYHHLKRQYPSLSLTTVYNTLEKLVSEGLVQEIMIDNERRRFDPNPVPHQHFFCLACRRVFDLQPPLPVPSLPREVEGFWVTKWEINLYGFCAACRLKEEE